MKGGIKGAGRMRTPSEILIRYEEGKRTEVVSVGTGKKSGGETTKGK